MDLTPEQRAMLEGGRGEPSRLAMRILAAVGRACDAERLIPVASAHLVIDGTALGAVGLELMERLVRQDGRFVIPTTINAIAVDRRATTRAALSDDQRAQLRLLEACETMGCISSCSCNPFIQGFLPALGEAVAWSESATAPYVNSVLGARTNREGATALASALTGLSPAYGMHLDHERKAGIVFAVTARIAGLHRFSLLGALIGRRCGGRVPAILGIERAARDELIGFGAAFAIHGSVNMYHMIGITPEAPDLGTATAGDCCEVVTIDEAALAAEWRRTQHAGGTGVDIVSIGCPHASIDQIGEVAARLAGRPVHDGVTFFVHTNDSTFAAAERAGLVDRLSAAGVRLTADNCAVVSYDRLPRGARLATNSAKMAFLAAAANGVDILYGGVDDCVDAAATGAWRGNFA